jgi:outer membrane protein insertion porin family
MRFSPSLRSLRHCLAILALAACTLGRDVLAQVPAAPKAAPGSTTDTTQVGPPSPQTKEMPTVVAIRVEGARRYTEAQLTNALGQKVGAKFDADAVQKGLDTLWNALRVRAEVLRRDVEGGVELLLKVVEMNVDLEPRFVGNAQIPVDTLKKWALLEDRGELFLYQAERVRHRLIEGYHKEGYAFADVDIVRRGSESGANEDGVIPDVIFEIREGPQVRVKEVVVRGNTSMPDRGMWWWKDGLKKLAKSELDGPWLFNWKGDKFVQDTLDADIVAMREVYRDRGFLDAVIDVETLEFSADRTGVVVHVVVDEGSRYKVSGMRLVGVKRVWNSKARAFDETPEALLFPEKELLGMCKLQVGVRYERTKQNQDGQKLRDYYGERGYLAHPSLQEDYFEFLDPEFVFDPKAHTVDVTYRIAQGRKRYIREVMFQGGEHTRDRVLRREVDMMPGELADLTKIRKSLGRIYSTSFFNDEQAPLEHHDPTFSFKPTGNPEVVDLEYKVEEGKVVNLQLQGGVDTNSGIFGRIQIVMRNFDVTDTPDSFWSMFGDILDKEAFHGAGQELELELSPGTVVNSYRVRFVEPDLFRTHFDRYSLDLELYRRNRSQRFYDEDRLEKKVRIGREFGREFTMFVGYTNQDLKVTNLDSELTSLNDPVETPLPSTIYPQEGSTKLVGGLLDFQYRSVDQFLNPRSGTTWAWHNAVYGGLFGGDYDFVKSYIDYDYFWMPPGDPDEIRAGFHLGVGFGLSEPYGDTQDTPYTERFFLGGSRVLRGFAYRGVGPNNGENTLGGQNYMDASLEYRIPVYTITQPGTYKELETFRFTLFTDAGVLGQDTFTLGFQETRWSWGVGLGMVYPFPISLNFGFPLLYGEGDRREVFSLTIFNLSF